MELKSGVRHAKEQKQTTQRMTLVNSINSDDTRLSAKMERYLTSAALVLAAASHVILYRVYNQLNQ